MLIIPKISRLSRSTNGSNKKHWKKDNSVQITFATFSDLSPSLSSFSISIQLLFIPVSDSPLVFRPFPSNQSRKAKFIHDEERNRERERGRKGIWNWGKPLMRRSCKSPVKVTELLSQWISPTERIRRPRTRFQRGLEGIIGRSWSIKSPRISSNFSHRKV